MCKILLYLSKSRFLASLLVEVGEYDISGPNEMMSTKEMKVETRPSGNYEKDWLHQLFLFPALIWTDMFWYFLVQVKRVVVHKDYQAPTFENDIAILELEDPIQRQPHVVPICMPRWTSISMPSSHFHSYSTSSSHAAISIFIRVITVCLLIGITTRSSWTQ